MRTQPQGDRSRTRQVGGQESCRILRRSWLQSTRDARALVCRRWPRCLWRMRRPTWWTPPPSVSSRLLRWRRRKEEEERKRITEEKVQLLAVPLALRTPEQRRRIAELCAESLASCSSQPGRRKRKKRKKKKLPRGSSRSFARRRQRQWHAWRCWFYWLRSSLRCVTFDFWQARDARLHCRYGAEGLLQVH